jgi:hypothetical protein
LGATDGYDGIYQQWPAVANRPHRRQTLACLPERSLPSQIVVRGS